MISNVASLTHATNVSDFVSSANSCSISSALDDKTLLQSLKTHVNASVTGSLKTMERHPGVQPDILARRWGTGLGTAKNTIQATTQRGTRTVLHPSLSRRFRTNDRQLRYQRLRSDMHGDILESKTTSKRGNNHAVVFATPYGWSRAFPIAKKSDAHDGLSLLFKRDGVPPSLILDNANELSKGEFARKARQADCYVKTTEPHSQWQNAAEGGIRELKRGAGRKMVKMKSPKTLWDDCLELEALIRSNAAHDVHELKGEVPKTVLSGETSDTSSFCELGWHEWVKFRDTSVPCPEDKEVLGRHLGPSIDTGPAMTAKIRKSNGQCAHRSTCHALTPDG